MLTIAPTGAVLGATARGIDLARPLSERDMSVILLAWTNMWADNDLLVWTIRTARAIRITARTRFG